GSEQACGIVHIPKVLYHVRREDKETRRQGDREKNGCHSLSPSLPVSLSEATASKALTEHVERLGLAATVQEGVKPGTFRLVYSLPSRPLVSIVIPNRDQPTALRRCLTSLHWSSYTNFGILIIENESKARETFAYYDEITRQPHIRILNWTRLFNYSAVNNFAAEHAQGEVLLFLNNDTEVITCDWLECLL